MMVSRSRRSLIVNRVYLLLCQVESTMSVNFDWDMAVQKLKDLHKDTAYHSPEVCFAILSYPKGVVDFRT